MNERFGPFTLVRRLGKGGMGECFLARDEAGATCAVKRMLTGLHHDTEYLKRFHREAWLASLVHHPNIVPVLQSGVEGGAPWLSMPYVDGASLRHIIRGARALGTQLPLGAVLRALADACAGLHAVHQMRDPETGAPLNVIHRDVSPENILLDRGGVARVSDFGIARADAFTASSGARVWGKNAYMAPEQVRGGAVDLRADIFSLGVVAYELLTLERPFPGKGALAWQHILFSKPAALRTHRPDAPRSLSSLIDRMLAKTADKRFQSCADVKVAIEAVQAEFGFDESAVDLLLFDLRSDADAPTRKNDDCTRPDRGRIGLQARAG